MIDFWPYISPNHAKRLDPINLVFFGNATPQRVEDCFRHRLDRTWEGAFLSHPMFAYIDDTDHGGRRIWKRQVVDLTLGNVVSRHHVRIFACDRPDPDSPEGPGFGHWCIAAVHREHHDWPLDHIVESWDEARDLVRDAFEGCPFTGEVFTMDLGAAGHWHGPPFDGQVAFIELT